jgi:hypothetical protein
MVKQQTPSQQFIPSTDLENQFPPLNAADPSPAETAGLTLTTTAVEQEISARGDDSYYANHWGINE